MSCYIVLREMIFNGFMLHSNPITLIVIKPNYLQLSNKSSRLPLLSKTLHNEIIKGETTLNYLDIATMQIFCAH